MKAPNKDYENLHNISLQARILSGVSGIISWDEETYMPPGAATIRGEQLKVLAGMIHKIKTGPAYAKALTKLIDIPKGTIKAEGLSKPQQASLKQWRRDYLRDKALPIKFVEDMAKLTSQSINVWREARSKNAFLQFAPYLDKIILMMRKKADYLGYEDHPYDALLDLYEPEMKTKDIDLLFTPLRKSISALFKQLMSAKQIDDKILKSTVPDDKQIEFSKYLLKEIGFDFHKGRLDISTHPFSSSSHPTDNRITTRINKNMIMDCISGTLHEAGHALYEAGLPIEHYGSPLGEHISMGVHESQSRWWEKWIGQSKSFWKRYLPELQKVFGNKFKDVSLDHFYRAINKVEPSFIRVEADEVTYPLHVILRFELEKAMIEGSLKIRDLPDAWNEKMQDLIGITPKTNSEGCMQDIHWAWGAFGYFPTYTLGNMYAAQLFVAFSKQHSNWERRIEQGDFAFVKEWLHHNVHQYGRQYNSKELIKKATGKVFKQDDYVDYLTNKYKALYLN